MRVSIYIREHDQVVVDTLGGSHIDTFRLKESRAVIRQEYGRVKAVPEVSIKYTKKLGPMWGIH